ncbi:copper resistance CopC/CopD family protein [Paenisporosarcina cavernae]|uniref:CopC domain-containing protein n=1 Tax=Paenisporosarcina cavernae TaxID=2320858 RepID=A0A385YTG3_9BACL|nr:copper resistance protein CopC [Paenisporosarcina cavernae]AYC28862.1 hypothetical protein D3873_02865 [Paenisporosarcina cavernae]
MRVVSIIFAFIGMFFLPLTTFAHTSLERTIPEAGSVVDVSPSTIELRFSDPLDAGVFEVRLSDSTGAAIPVASTTVSDDAYTLILTPENTLEHDVKVTYSVVSKDGHPVAGDYSFTVTPPPVVAPEPEPDTSDDPVVDESETDASTSDGKMDDSANKEPRDVPLTVNTHSNHAAIDHNVKPLSAVAKGIFLGFLLLVIGLTIWRHTGVPVRYYGGFLFALLVSMVVFLLTQVFHFLEVFENSYWNNFLFDTQLGRVYFGMILLIILGLYLLGRNKWVDYGWIFIMIVLKSINSHASSSEFPFLSIALNSIHLVAAGLWVAGIYLLFMLWKDSIKMSFMKQFSRVAFWSLVIMAFTGTIYTAVLTNDFVALLTSAWGYWLIFKLQLVIGVVIVASFIRQKMKDDPAFQTRGLLISDAVLALLILLVVGVLTLSSTAV